MTSLEKTKSDLDKKFQKVSRTQASFDFFVAIHGFIKYVELNPSLALSLLHNTKVNREMNISGKYGYLKQIYQGLEDVNTRSNVDLGHARYAMIKDLNKIHNNDVSESNSLWKKRESLRKSVGEVHARLCTHLSKLK